MWNFNNGACIKTLVKPLDPQSRQEITGMCCYIFEDKRFMAATSWDRKITVWLDYSEDSGAVTPYMQMQGQDTDILSIAFAEPKSIAAACADGNIGIFDVESGYKKMSLTAAISNTGRTPRDAKSALGNSQFVERIIFLEHHNRTMVSAGADGCLRFWEGQWMPIVPLHCATSVTPSRMACMVPGNHYRGFALVDVRSDDENRFLVTADEAGFVKTWDISNYNWKSPDPDMVQPISFWQAHQVGVSTVDIMAPSNIDNHPEEELQPLVFTCASDKCAMLWTVGGAHVGKFGQPLNGRAAPWELYDKTTWQSAESLDLFEEQHSGLGSPMSRESDSEESDDEDHFNAVLNDLDERLRQKAPGKAKFVSSCFQGQNENGIPLATLDEVPAEMMSKVESTKKKGKDYVVDEITGERIYKGSKKAVVGEERRKPMTSYLRHFTKKVDPEGIVHKTPRGGVNEDPKEAEKKITYATASTLMKVYDAKCERQEWGEPDALQKDILCTKIRHALQIKRDPDAHVDRVANYLIKLGGSNWDELLTQADTVPM